MCWEQNGRDDATRECRSDDDDKITRRDQNGRHGMPKPVVRPASVSDERWQSHLYKRPTKVDADTDTGDPVGKASRPIIRKRRPNLVGHSSCCLSLDVDDINRTNLHRILVQKSSCLHAVLTFAECPALDFFSSCSPVPMSEPSGLMVSRDGKGVSIPRSNSR